MQDSDLHKRLERSLGQTLSLFGGHGGDGSGFASEEYLAYKFNDEYAPAEADGELSAERQPPAPTGADEEPDDETASTKVKKSTAPPAAAGTDIEASSSTTGKKRPRPKSSTAVMLHHTSATTPDGMDRLTSYDRSLVLLEKRRRLAREQKPEWHAPWKLFRVVSGHMGWVRALAVDVTNRWFASGSSDRTIKIWDLATSKLKLTLPGHINTIRDMVMSDRLPYLFSVGEDKQIKVWDMEQNQCVKQFHGHLSGVYCCDTHPTLELLATGGRDASARLWDIRTKAEVFILTGHRSTVNAVRCQGSEPQVITGSADETVRCWDLRTGKARVVLTNHKKGIRDVLIHPTEYTFASAAADNLKKWLCPDARFLMNFEIPEKKIVNTLAINHDNVLFSGADDGTMWFWDWKTGYCFQKMKSIPQSGSLEAEAGILVARFDRSGARLITGEVDKTIKIYREDDKATPETHPVQYMPAQKSFF